MLFEQEEEDSPPVVSSSQKPGLPDEAARALALDIHRSWIVEAPAGSGKTGLLIQRLLRLLAHAEISSPNQVLAITFTRKAAQELRHRVLEQLTSAAAQEPLPQGAAQFATTTRTLAEDLLRRDRQLKWHLLESPHQLNIRTIDSFCAELARGLPLLGGGIGQRTPVDDASALYEEAAGRVVRQLGGPENELHRALEVLLLHRDGRVQDCIRLIADMLASREQWGDWLPLGSTQVTDSYLEQIVRPQLEGTLGRVIQHELEHTISSLPQGWLADLAFFAARLSSEPGFGGQISPLLPCQGCPEPPTASPDQMSRWITLIGLVLTADGAIRSSISSRNLGFELPIDEKPQLLNLLQQLRTAQDLGSGARDQLCAVRDLPLSTMPQEQWHVLKAILHVLRRALVELEVLFAEREICDYTSLSLAAQQMLRQQGDAASVERLQHLLVDEMQDTSVGQYRILEQLTQSWDGASQTVFLVGDPKQSIYAFRQARVERFLRTQNTGLLGEVPLGSLQLTSNFRSQAELVQGFNQLFQAILPPAAEPAINGMSLDPQQVDAPFIAADPVRPPVDGPALQWHLEVQLESTGSPSRAAETQARQIRHQIEAYLARTPHSAKGGSRLPSKGQSAPRVAVLGRNRAHLAPILEEFQRDDGGGTLPYRATEIEALSDRPEVLDLLALTRALLYPTDRVAWLAVLRSPVCGLSLADLLRLTGEGPEANNTATVAYLIRTRQHYLSPGGRLRLEQVWPVLARAQKTARTASIATQVERTWRSLGADAWLGANALANARRYLALLAQMEQNGEPIRLQTLERRLNRLFAEAASPDALVELMTIHKAKGLEWELVIIPSLDRKPRAGDIGLLRWLELDEPEQEGRSLVLAPVPGKGEEASKLWRWLSKLGDRRELAEAKRLLYVGCTRARDELHLYGTVQANHKGGLATPDAKSLLRASWPATSTIAEAAQAEASSVDTSSEQNHSDGPFLLQLAAEAEPPRKSLPPLVRLPVSFSPVARFAPGPELQGSPPPVLSEPARGGDRQRSFAARAVDTVLRNFLRRLTGQLTKGHSPSTLSETVASWEVSIQRALLAEGLPEPLGKRKAAQILVALKNTLADPASLWLFQPKSTAWDMPELVHMPAQSSTPDLLHADRAFLAGFAPLSVAHNSHLWILGVQSTEKGAVPNEEFWEEERQKYAPGMRAFAETLQETECLTKPLILALFYPFLPHLVYWPFLSHDASDFEV